VLDRSPAGNQPMADCVDGRQANWITYNGEVYNTNSLRKKLADAGFTCRTGTDTEVIMHAYRLWGHDAVVKMRGMFAWCFLDSAAGRAWFCRDRLGIKQLYIFRPPSGGLIFSSEVRALLACGPKLVPAHICQAAIESLLAQGYVAGPGAIVEGVWQVAPGESMISDWGGEVIARKQYWRSPYRASGGPILPRPEVVDRVRGELSEAVQSQLSADVPVGVFLSSGLDSSTIAALASSSSERRLATISLSCGNADCDEAPLAAAFARGLGSDHRQVSFDQGTVTKAFNDFLAAVDQPTMDGFNTFLVSRAAKEAGLKVMLSGLGGDEIFGGYSTFKDVPRMQFLSRSCRRLHSLAPTLGRAMAKCPWRSTRKLTELLNRPRGIVHHYFLRRELFLPSARRALHTFPEGCDPWCGMPVNMVDDLKHGVDSLDQENATSYLEVHAYMQNMLLRDADVFSMAHGVELRVPFLDEALAEMCMPLPGIWKRPVRGSGKPLLQAAMAEFLPLALRNRRKLGFNLPWAKWLSGPLRKNVQAIIHDRATWECIGVHPAAPVEVLGRLEAGRSGVTSLHLTSLLTLGDFAARHRLTIR
jgi:asparagine synthase (glutamine-hydrolysing)